MDKAKITNSIIRCSIEWRDRAFDRQPIDEGRVEPRKSTCFKGWQNDCRVAQGGAVQPNFGSQTTGWSDRSV